MIEGVCVEFVPDEILKMLGELSTKLGSRWYYILICNRNFNDLLWLLFDFFFLLLNFHLRNHIIRFLRIYLRYPLWKRFIYVIYERFSYHTLDFLIIHRDCNLIWCRCHLRCYRSYINFIYLFLRLLHDLWLFLRRCLLRVLLFFLFLPLFLLFFCHRNLLVSILADSQLQSSPLLIVHLGAGCAAVEGQVEQLLGFHGLNHAVDVRAYLSPHLVELVRLTHLEKMLIWVIVEG